MIGLLLCCLAACGPPVEVTLPAPTGTATPALSDIALARLTAEVFLDAWQSGDYAAMYAKLTLFSQDAISPADFEAQYQDVAHQLTLQDLNFELLSILGETDFVQVAYQTIFETSLLGEIAAHSVMNLVFETGEWRVQWDAGMIMPELKGGNHLELAYKIPSRGQIYDINGRSLAAYERAVAIGVVPGEILPEQATQVYQTLSALSSYDPDEIAQMIADTPADWYLPIVSVSAEAVTPYIQDLSTLEGIRLDEFRARYYVDGGIAPHALGYMLYISEEDLPTYQALGYQQDERVGASGLEAAYEFELAGQRGATLYVVNPEGKVLSVLASQDPVPGQSLVTTLDADLQLKIQDSLGNLRAAVVVMEAETGRVLSLVSSPSFDPNAFDLTHIDRSLLDSYFSDPSQPLFNRATQGQYPLGSVFKVISLAAALETNLYSPDSQFICGHSLWVCDSVTLYDWTLEHGAAASGELTLLEGLMRSCNPWFYRIGENLFAAGQDQALSNVAFSFGLGAQTGIEIDEASGYIPSEPGTCINSAQMAIGQGEVLVTPLQVASFIAAVANGGRLHRPALVEEVRTYSGEASQSFSPQVIGDLDVSPETLRNVQEAMRMVVENPRGTAYWSLQDLEIAVSGKTGTAQTPTGNSHAWFAGYSRQHDPQHPDIAVVVLIENGGEGSVMAAPVFRRVISLYFSDGEDAGGLLPWEVEAMDSSPDPSPTSPSDE
jgi:penicillin-binding protein 2